MSQPLKATIKIFDVSQTPILIEIRGPIVQSVDVGTRSAQGPVLPDEILWLAIGSGLFNLGNWGNKKRAKEEHYTEKTIFLAE